MDNEKKITELDSISQVTSNVTKRKRKRVDDSKCKKESIDAIKIRIPVLKCKKGNEEITEIKLEIMKELYNNSKFKDLKDKYSEVKFSTANILFRSNLCDKSHMGSEIVWSCGSSLCDWNSKNKRWLERGLKVPIGVSLGQWIAFDNITPEGNLNLAIKTYDEDTDLKILIEFEFSISVRGQKGTDLFFQKPFEISLGNI